MTKLFTKLAKGTSSRELENVVTKRLALEGSKFPAQVTKAKIYNAAKSIPFAGPKVGSVAMSMVKERHGPMIKQVLGNDKPDTLLRVGRGVAENVTKPTKLLQQQHTADSTSFVDRGGKYPEYLNEYYNSPLWKARASSGK